MMSFETIPNQVDSINALIGQGADRYVDSSSIARAIRTNALLA